MTGHRAVTSLIARVRQEMVAIVPRAVSSLIARVHQETERPKGVRDQGAARPKAALAVADQQVAGSRVRPDAMAE